GSTSGNLNVINLATNSSVPGLSGYLYAGSAMWTNYAFIVLTNYSYDTNNTPPATPIPFTNTTEIDFHVLFVDATALSSTLPVTVQDLILNSTNMVVSDSMNVVNRLLFNG